ncbi:hypothetical protein BABINDRAFT_159548 [Babjeviella inositovora NRRL Y-12698]|uniref:Major facilitator superfamily (MFS) profile domain-containing protein n=1 Tax=Babjeviella inositovora NRRL Y-12698 TaxID=984486 RepID=A0A1E3QZM1_9ASCO|nr:uncharacterized protein BABINDRAFT_159548 [Babjeviella inositovora NRRL Y-12698]ODQ83088.1 hypothetical protein BABINDRAFT_159548 [Babjeviella inositovora NRRL Y-12698]
MTFLDPETVPDTSSEHKSPELMLAPDTAPDAAPLAKTTTTTSISPTIVPMDKRRGLLLSLTLVPEYDDPRNYSPKVKYFIVFVIGICAVIGPLGSSIVLPAIDDMCQDLNTTVSVVNVSVGMYLLSMGIMPLWWSSFSERHGRRSIYMISFFFFFAFSFGTALAPSIGALIVFRVLVGGCSASVQSVGAGTISDLYLVEERGFALGLYYLGPLMGPLLAPIIGGALSIKWGWRASQWLLVIWAGVCLLLVTFALPETLRRQDNMANIKALIAQQKAASHHDDIESSPGLKHVSDTEGSLHSSNSEVGSLDSSDDESHLVLGPSAKAAINDPQKLQRVLSVISSSRNSIHLVDGLDTDAYQTTDSILPPLSRVGTRKERVEEFQRLQLAKLESAIFEADKNLECEQETWQQKWKHYGYIYVVLPTKSLNLLRYPPLIMAIAYSAPCFAILYFVNMTLSYEYARAPYNFSSVICGLVYIPNSVTYLIASIWGGRWTDYLLAKKKARDGYISPESRLSWNVVVAACAFPVSLMIIGWTFNFHTHWVTPLIGTALFGFASMIIIGVTVTYIVDQLPGKGATGVAVNNFVRMIMAAICTFITEPLIVALGTGVLFSILSGIIIVLAMNVFILKKRGEAWREKYDLQKLYDLMQ